MNAVTFECGGPRVSSYEDLLRTVTQRARLKPLLIPVPFAAWHAMAGVAELFPSPPFTRNQVELMQVDNVTSPEMPGFAELAISPRSVDEILREILSASGLVVPSGVSHNSHQTWSQIVISSLGL